MALNWEKANRRESVGWQVSRASREASDMLSAARSKPTVKQRRFIASLSKQLGIKQPRYKTRHQASELISDMLRRKAATRSR